MAENKDTIPIEDEPGERTFGDESGEATFANDPMKDYGGYADCCGANEADNECKYRPPAPELVNKYARKVDPDGE